LGGGFPGTLEKGPSLFGSSNLIGRTGGTGFSCITGGAGTACGAAGIGIGIPCKGGGSAIGLGGGTAGKGMLITGGT